MALINASIYFDHCNISKSFENQRIRMGLPEEARFDFKKISRIVALGMNIISKNVYLAEPKNSGNGFNSFIKSLEDSGFKTTIKTPKVIKTDDGEKNKCDFDVEITRDICKTLFTGVSCQEFIIFSGDSDFSRLKEDMKEYGARLTIVSALDRISSESTNISDRLILLEDLDRIAKGLYYFVQKPKS